MSEPIAQNAGCEEFDVIIIGAGISGVGAACRLQQLCPGRSYCLLDRREHIGGTWDFFQFPGVRSDSDMWTYAYPFQPWHHPKILAPRSVILDYMQGTADDHGLMRHIRFGEDVAKASWSSAKGRWHVETAQGHQYSCQFIMMCTGYYEYDTGFQPTFEGRDSFKGKVIHPQEFTPDIEYAGRKVAVVGSGATAITMLPVVAEKAEHVAWVQRSPSYIASRPSELNSFGWLRPYISADAFYYLNRWRSMLLMTMVTKGVALFPKQAKNAVLKETAEKLEGASINMKKDFTPRYFPWEERFCMIPDDDLFDALKSGRVSVTTGPIERLTESGILIRDGIEVEADIIVMATGMNVQQNLPFSNIQVTIDGESNVRGASRMIYKSCMLSGVPNLTFAFGYLKGGSWTQKSDLTAVFACRLLNHMAGRGLAYCCPHRDPAVAETRMHDFSSGYLARAEENLPKTGAEAPWDRPENFYRDYWRLTFAPLAEKSLHFHAGNIRSRL